MKFTDLACWLSDSGVLGLNSLLQRKLYCLRDHISSVRQLYCSVLDNSCELFGNINDDDYLREIDIDDEDIQYGSDYNDEEDTEEENE